VKRSVIQLHEIIFFSVSRLHIDAVIDAKNDLEFGQVRNTYLNRKEKNGKKHFKECRREISGMLNPDSFLWKLCDLVTWPKERSHVLLRTATRTNFCLCLIDASNVRIAFD